MARYKDLDRLDYFGAPWAGKLLAVGWIESAEQCRGGDLETTFFEALIDLLVDPWQPFAVSGLHRCTLCRFTGGPSSVNWRSRTVQIGAANLFVADQDRAYVAPSSIVHYVDAHGYCPPSEFQLAVLKSPPMRSMDYLKLIRGHELHRLAAPSPRANEG